MESLGSLSYLLAHTATILYRQTDQALQERLGIGMSQFKILMLLIDQPKVQQRYLAESLGQTEASISRQIKLLCQRGMLVAATNPANRRQRVASPTPKGVKVARAAQEVVDEYHDPTFSQITDKQQRQLLEMLRAMHATVCQAGKPYACEYGAGIGEAWHTT